MLRSMRVPAIALAGLLVAGMIGSGCNMMGGKKEGGDATSADPNTLYNRLGGRPAITKVVDDFVNRAATNPNVNFFRKNVPGATEWKPSQQELTTFKQNLVDFVVQASGGPKVYKGGTMAEVHRGMHITSAEFDALAGDLKAALDGAGVKPADRDELLKAVAGTKKDIIDR